MRFKILPAFLVAALICSQTVYAQACEKAAAYLEAMEGVGSVKSANDDQWQIVGIGYQFCYGDIFKVEQLRATLRLENDTLVKLNQGSVIKFVPPKESFWVEIIDGVGHFISRTPKSFTVKAPYLNAGVEGTEFIVAHDSARDTVSVVEGIVVATNDLGSTRLLAMQQSYATQGTAPSPALVISLPDVANWSLYYPPAFIPTDTNSPSEQAYLKGNFAKSYQLALSENSSEIVAALSLFYGQRQVFDKAIHSSDGFVAKVLSVVQKLVQGDSVGALFDSQALVALYPNQPSVLLAHSYALQASGELSAALASAQQAKTQNDSGIIELRIAELALITGDQKLANRSLDTLNQANFYSAYADSLQALIALQNNRNRKAFAILQVSLAKNPNIPLTQFAMGLTNIRLGKLEIGRQNLELAVALDPSNSLYRSYLGKAYAEENRTGKAQDQLDLAKVLDSNDPTPWFYQGLNQQANGEYASAIESYEQSIELNDKRNIYRSNTLLQSDAAIKSANIGTSYNQRGLNKKAQLLGSQIISEEPNSYAGHSLLVEAYAGNNQKESLLASERLKATLLQPLGATALPIGLLEPGLQTTNGASPSDIGISEYTNLFIEDGIGGRATLLGGSDELGAYDVVMQAKHEQIAISLGQYKYKTDGYRENNDADYKISNALLHWEPKQNLSFQFEYGQFKDEHGDLTTNINDSEFNPNYRIVNDSAVKRISSRYVFNSQQDFILNYSNRDRNYYNDDAFLTDFGAGEAYYELKTEAISSSNQFDGQYHFRTYAYGNYIVGLNYYNFESENQVEFLGQQQQSKVDFRLKSAYFDYKINHSEFLEFDLGLDYSSLEQYNNFAGNIVERDFTDELLPYVGIKWDFISSASFRGAYSEAYAFDQKSYTSLKTTTIAGFSRLLDFPDGAKIDIFGLGFDWDVGRGVNFYLERSNNNIVNTVNAFVVDRYRFVDLPIELQTTTAWLEYTQLESFAAIFKLEDQNYSRKIEQKAPGIMPLSLESNIVGIEFKLKPATNIEISMRSRYLNQQLINEPRLGEEPQSKQESGTIDASISYYFFNRQGVMRVGLNNITDEKYLVAEEDLFSFVVSKRGFGYRRSYFASVTYNFY